MCNVAILVGRICSDPFYIEKAKATKFKMATKIGYDAKNKKGKSAYVPVVAYGLSEEQRSLITKGRLICVEGEVQEFRYEKQGVTKYETEVVVQKSNIEFLGAPKGNKSSTDENHLGMDPDKDFQS